MKIVFLTFVILFHSILTYSLSGDNFEEKSGSIFFDGRELVLENGEDTIFFGNCFSGSSCTYSLVVSNQSDVNLWITNVRGSCGLSVPVWPRTEIYPGESATIQIRYDSQRIGDINRNLTIQANTYTGSTVLKLAGRVLQGP